jgi:hypothetical protein
MESGERGCHVRISVFKSPPWLCQEQTTYSGMLRLFSHHTGFENQVRPGKLIYSSTFHIIDTQQMLIKNSRLKFKCRRIFA